MLKRTSNYDISLDKAVERDRYDSSAAASSKDQIESFAELIPLYLREPYEIYEKQINLHARPSIQILELGCGLGNFSHIPLNLGASLTALDISHKSLKVFTERFSRFRENVTAITGDIETLPFGPKSFDMVIAAGVLSYGDNFKVRDEIHRVLVDGGTFVCVDSLNNNPIYVINRWLHFIKGRRTRGTLLRMPTLRYLADFRSRFSYSTVLYFGSASWLISLIASLLGPLNARALSTFVDRKMGVQGSAFKFVMVVKK